MSLTRREFVTQAAGLAALGMGAAAAPAQENRSAARGGGTRPVLIASANGRPACNRAMELLREGIDPVDAVVAGINIVEDNPEDHSVGYGGLPNAAGVVQLDSCVMHGPTHKGGAVGALENIRHPSSVAALVMRRTDHVLLVGAGAKEFALAHGFKEENLLTDEARQMWLSWKERLSDRDNWLRPGENPGLPASGPAADEAFTHGTITCMALTAGGDLGGCTSTSGLSYKIPGRVGDSPILGAGLYVDNEAGACGSTGRGEANLLNGSCLLVVELMRGGMTPTEACLEILRRVVRKTEKRLLDADGLPNYGLSLYAVRKDGVVGGASLRGPGHMTLHDGTEACLIEIPGLLPAFPQPARPVKTKG